MKASDGYVGAEYSTLSFVTNVLTQSIAQVVESTASKMFGIVTGPELVATVAVFVIMAYMQMIAILQQGTTVRQSTFIPTNTMATILLNAVFGLIVWEDWKVVQSWLGYTLVLLQIVLGNYQLSDYDFFEEVFEERANASLLSVETVQNLGRVPVEKETGLMRSVKIASIRNLNVSKGTDSLSTDKTI